MMKVLLICQIIMHHNHQTKRTKSKRCQHPEKAREMFYVHELVAKTFVSNPDNHPYIEHIDGDKLNNRADNLRWTAIKPEGYPTK